MSGNILRRMLFGAMGMQILLASALASAPEFARNFVLDSTDGVVRLRVFVRKDTVVYALCPQGRCVTKVDARTRVIPVPLHRVICMSSVQAGFLEALDLRDRIIGMDETKFVCDSALRAAGKRGAWSQVGAEDQIDWEKVMALRPDMVFYSFPPGGSGSLKPKADALRIPSLAFADWLENHPLGRAEWMKVYGALFGREQKADSLFNAVRNRYDSLKTVAKLRAKRPTAIAGLGWHGQWFVGGGGSYVAQVQRDAGIHYLWEDDTHTGSLSLGLETLLEKGRDADLWISPGEAHSMAELIRLEPRSDKFRSFREGRVYQHDARHCADGGDLYWESGATRPDFMLSDLLKITEGGLEKSSGHYFRRLPQVDSKAPAEQP